MKKSNNNIKLLQWNARSITQNVAYLEHFLSKNECQVLMLQSLNTTLNKLPKLPNYYYPPVCNIGTPDQKIYSAIYIYLKSHVMKHVIIQGYSLT